MSLYDKEKKATSEPATKNEMSTRTRAINIRIVVAAGVIAR
jgi:hypothetical protein